MADAVGYLWEPLPLPLLGIRMEGWAGFARKYGLGAPSLGSFLAAHPDKFHVSGQLVSLAEGVPIPPPVERFATGTKTEMADVPRDQKKPPKKHRKKENRKELLGRRKHVTMREDMRGFLKKKNLLHRSARNNYKGRGKMAPRKRKVYYGGK